MFMGIFKKFKKHGKFNLIKMKSRIEGWKIFEIVKKNWENSETK